VRPVAHKCIRCGKEYKNSSADLLNGCTSCGGRKFYFLREDAALPAQHEKKPEAEPSRAAPEKPVPPVPETIAEPEEKGEKVESIRILGPGSYELNIAKVGKDGSYVVDLLSMAKPAKKSKKKK
jgi:predicted  nucleic acid-binding Zn-ribbon protein